MGPEIRRPPSDGVVQLPAERISPTVGKTRENGLSVSCRILRQNINKFVTTDHNHLRIYLVGVCLRFLSFQVSTIWYSNVCDSLGHHFITFLRLVSYLIWFVANDFLTININSHRQEDYFFLAKYSSSSLYYQGKEMLVKITIHLQCTRAKLVALKKVLF